MHQIEPLTISLQARKVIDGYLALPIGERPSCPYFNNKRKKSRSALRVLVGKGTPEDIAEECEIQALQSRIKVSALSKEKLKEFLVEKNIGVDCSGFAYHVLDALSKEKTGKSLRNNISVTRKGFLGKIIAKLRAAENVNVATLADAKNSAAVEAKNVKPGDIIVFLGTGKDKTYNHVVLVTTVSSEQEKIVLSYAHSYAWPSDGVYDHGVREGSIVFGSEGILEGTWHERKKTGPDNYTFQSAKDAQHVSVRRMKFLA